MNTESVNDYPLVIAEGEVDHWKAPELEQKINDLINQGYQKIILDFRNLTYIDSGGVAVLFMQLQKLQPKNGSIITVTSNKNIIKILDLVKISKQKGFSLCSTMEEAKKLAKGD